MANDPPLPRPLAVVYHPQFSDFAGAELVTAWMLEALRPSHRVYVWAWRQPDWTEVDRRFGTRLASDPPGVLRPRPSTRALAAGLRGRGRLLLETAVQCELLALHRRLRPARWIGAYNETWLPAPGWLYLHHPERVSLPPPAGDWPAWRRALFLAGRRALLPAGLGRAVPPAGHCKLTNSRWTRARYAAIGGGETTIVHPPVPPFAAGRPWEQRENRVVMLGRWSRVKGLTRAIRIVARARAAGADLTLAFAGFWHCPPEGRREIEAAAAGLPWIEWHERLARPELMELAGRSRYGLHAMVGEHFGIAVAELAAAGCIVFAPEDGGPAEIVDDPRQLYADEAGAAARLLEVVRSPALQAELHAAARPRALRFSPERFRREFIAAIEAGPGPR